MDGTAAGYVVTVIPQPVAAGGGVAEVVVAVEVVAVVDGGPNLAQQRRPHNGAFFLCAPAIIGRGERPG